MSFLLYGAYGYTGALIAREAVRRGLHPVLAGRDAARLTPLATELGLESTVVDLRDRGALEAALRGQPVVVHAAGPFTHTARPMAEACLQTETHYLDLTGEIEVFEMLAAMDAAARQAGVMLLPGAGFDVVPSDCLAAHLKRRLPSATHLEMAFSVRGGISHGTAATTIEDLGKRGAVRRDGRIERVPLGWKTRTVDFGRGPVEVVSIPWGDVATAYYSTGIPNIVTYIGVHPVLRFLIQRSRYLRGVLSWAPVQALLRRLIRLLPPGPNAAQRARGRSYLWGAVTDEAGARAVARLRGPEAYALTVDTVLASVEWVLAGQAPAGFQTPATAFGADFLLEINGVTREDVAD